MRRDVFIVLFHVCVALFATGVVFGLIDLTGWQGPPWLPIGTVALLAAGPANRWASTAHARWFG